MASTQAQTSLSDWNKRVAKYQSLGIPASAYTPIANYDIKRTQTSDAEPMNDLQADLAVYAAASHSQPITQSEPSPTSSKDPLVDLGRFVGDFGSDARNTLLGIPRGVATSVEDLFKPSTYKQIGQALEGKSGQGSGVGGYLRGLAAAPELSLIPGLSDAADLTSAAGRQQLATHPFSAIADVAPFVGPVTRLGASIAGVSDLERASLASNPSALAAAAAGKPLVFGLRAADRTLFTRAAHSGILGSDIARVANRAATAGQDPFFAGRGLPADASLGIGQYAVRRFLNNHSLDRLGKFVSTDISRATGMAHRLSADEAHDLEKLYKPIIEQAGSVEKGIRRLKEFSRKIRIGDFSDLSDYERSIIPALRDIESRYRARGLQSGDLAKIADPLGAGYESIYAADSPVVRNYQRFQRTSDLLDRAQERLQTELDRQQAAAQPRTVNVTRGPRAGTSYTRSGTPVEVPQTRWRRGIELPTHPAATQPVRTTTGYLRARHEELQDRVTKLTNMKRAAEAAYEKSYIRHSPEALNPRIAAQMQDFTRREIRSRNNVAADTPTAAERKALVVAGKLDEFNSVMERINNDPSTKFLRDTVGPQQWDAHLKDVVTENARLAASGKGPIYFHSVAASDLERGAVQRVRLVHERAADTVEGMYRDTTLRYNAGTVHNFVAGFTRSAIDTFERDGMRSVYEGTLENGRLQGGIRSLQKRRGTAGDEGSLYNHYLNLAKIVQPKALQEDLPGIATRMLDKEWAPYDFDGRGFSFASPVEPRPDTLYLPRSVANNLQSFAETNPNRIFSSRGYHLGMRVFRTSVLYGPRHFAHTVLGGMMPMLASEPRAFLELARTFPQWRALMSGTQDERMYAMPALFKHSADWTTDEAFQLRAGWRVGNMLKQYWKTPQRISRGLGQLETIAHSMYQYSVYASKVRHGTDPDLAVEAARQVVVNFDSMAPFERTVMKQMMPFYSFTRFAMQYMLRYPTDHPLRFSFLTQAGSQTAEEWSQSGLPMEMMADIFFGKPNAQGNQIGVSYANLNPFRSVFNEFTLGGFLSSLNPAIGALFEAVGVNVLSGAPDSPYPDLQYNPTTGGVEAAPPGTPDSLLLGAEQIVPELNWVDLIGQINSTTRTTDPAGFERALWSSANLPFTPSKWNIPQERSRVAGSQYQIAQQAVSDYTKTGNAAALNRFNLIPFQSHLYTPQAFEAWWNQLRNQFSSLYPGVDPRSLIPSSGTIIPSQSVSGNPSAGLLGQITQGQYG